MPSPLCVGSTPVLALGQLSGPATPPPPAPAVRPVSAVAAPPDPFDVYLDRLAAVDPSRDFDRRAAVAAATALSQASISQSASDSALDANAAAAQRLGLLGCLRSRTAALADEGPFLSPHAAEAIAAHAAAAAAAQGLPAPLWLHPNGPADPRLTRAAAEARSAPIWAAVLILARKRAVLKLRSAEARAHAEGHQLHAAPAGLVPKPGGELGRLIVDYTAPLPDSPRSCARLPPTWGSRRRASRPRASGLPAPRRLLRLGPRSACCSVPVLGPRQPRCRTTSATTSRRPWRAEAPQSPPLADLHGTMASLLSPAELHAASQRMATIPPPWRRGPGASRLPPYRFQG
mmetsp:Transcript_16460/g.55966  ORF Transcript_16460/g.55966 Transcript_16460/m.55966 type:complete len:346 (-) Transcript_16460:106-1143(-)